MEIENKSINLTDIAYKRMEENGFFSSFPKEVLQEVSKLTSHTQDLTNKDMRELLWVSIDNDDSKDLDQLTYAEKLKTGEDKIFVAIADVNHFVKKQSAIDLYAAHNTTTVYTPTKIFPMLPLELSTDLTSLNESSERQVIIVEMFVKIDGQYELRDVYQALVKNKAKLTYNQVAAWLEKSEKITSDTQLFNQIALQYEIAQRIKKFRYRQGAISFVSKEIHPIISNGSTIGLIQQLPNKANKIIENFMITANSCITHFMTQKKLPIIRRVVKSPKRWDRIVELAKQCGENLSLQPDPKSLSLFLARQKSKNPNNFPELMNVILKLIGKGEYVLAKPGEDSGHFDLALSEYTHATAPNRRYPDLILQRILKNSFSKTPLEYSDEELTTLAAHCTLKEDDATKVVRSVNKSAIAMYFSNQVGNTFSAIVTGASIKGTWVRLISMPIEGKLVKGYEGLDVGDHLNVQLIGVHIENGFIDFQRIR